jgi:hypothetical protein
MAVSYATRTGRATLMRRHAPGQLRHAWPTTRSRRRRRSLLPPNARITLRTSQYECAAKQHGLRRSFASFNDR